MLKQFFVVTSIASLPLINQYTKTFITKTSTFKKTIAQVNRELNEINITLDQNQQSMRNEEMKFSQQKKQQEEERLFNLILTPQVQKMLSKKARHKIQLINKLKNEQKSIIQTNSFILGIHSLGAFASPPFFYWSAILYASYSQLSLVNDLYTLKTGKKLLDLHSKTVADLYLKVSAVMLVVFGIRMGLRRLSQLVQTKQIVRRDP